MLKDDGISEEEVKEIKSGLSAMKAAAVMDIFSEEDVIGKEKSWLVRNNLSITLNYFTLPSLPLPPQSPSKALLADGIGENAHLTDNWDDAEGYYSKSSVNVQYTTF